MNIYYIYFFITLIFLGIIVLIYYNFNKNIEKFTFIKDTLMRDGTLECSWSNTRDTTHDCHGKTGNDVCTKCPAGQEPTNFNGEGFICTQVSECKVNCLKVSSYDFYTTPTAGETPGEHIGYKYFKENEEKTISELKMNDPACSPSIQCPHVNIPNCDIQKFDIVTEINDDEKLCCKYRRPDLTVTDIDSCPPAPGECPPVFKYEHFPEQMRDDGNPGVKLVVSSNDTNVMATHTWDRGAAYAFRKSNYPPVSYLDECPAHDENYSNLNAIGNCTTVGNDAYCCAVGNENKPAMINGMYPACDLTYVNLLNSVNKHADVLVTSNIIQMYSGYNLFDTNFYHIVHASNAKEYGFLSNDVFYNCISNDGSVSSNCSPTPDENTGEFILLTPEQVSPGITGGDIDENNLNTIRSSKLVGDGW